ncbi:hypothetical protein LCGC14_2243090 [marine sediment metagenome]|uniref:Uncharacterized protein n=1 Tax=marine sediment metagenome TaxID=412755 RepID=A0A0F9FHC2_9ZZZZ
MTYEELLEWGRTEAATRKAEMVTVDSAESLERVQDAVREVYERLKAKYGGHEK